MVHQSKFIGLSVSMWFLTVDQAYEHFNLFHHMYCFTNTAHVKYQPVGVNLVFTLSYSAN